MTIRVGLKHYSRAVRVLAREQVINGDFEDGATGWTFDSTQSYLTTLQYHSPTHSVFTYSDGYGFHQAISNLKVADVTSLTFYTLGTGLDVNEDVIKITLSDGTSVTQFVGNYASWTQVDVTSILPAGKVITEIRFLSGTTNPHYIDDVSLIAR